MTGNGEAEDEQSHHISTFFYEVLLKPQPLTGTANSHGILSHIDEDAEEENEEAMKATMPKAGEDEDLFSHGDADIDEDNDDLPADFSAAMANNEDDNLVNDEDEKSSDNGDAQAEEDDNLDGFSPIEDSDNDGLIP